MHEERPTGEKADVTSGDLRVAAIAAPLRTQVVRNLREAILDRRFTPGQRLVERELCELTGVSRTTVREALRQLETEGLVVLVPNQGPVVATMSLDEARDVYDVRGVLEALAASRFAASATDEQVRDLAARTDAFEEAMRSGVLAFLGKELLLRAFDADAARAMGYRTGLLDLVLNVLVALVVVAAVRAVGTVLVIALLIVPAATARLVTYRIGAIAGIGAVVGAVGGWLGLLASWHASIEAGIRLGSGATVVLALVAVYLLTLTATLVRPKAALAGGAA
ncbi:MAG: metal ABC transporter permease [Acidothermales bacterium]|nr:metal ABC transporter permease [Acidothermales bacterium]